MAVHRMPNSSAPAQAVTHEVQPVEPDDCGSNRTAVTGCGLLRMLLHLDFPRHFLLRRSYGSRGWLGNSGVFDRGNL